MEVISLPARFPRLRMGSEASPLAPRHLGLQREGAVADAWNMLVAALFPPTCIGCHRLIAIEGRLPLCSVCRADVIPLPSSHVRRDDVTALFAYGGVFATTVSRLKDAGDIVLAGPLGRLLATAPVLEYGWDLVVPVPSPTRRVLLRGIDHAAALARWMIHALPSRHRPRRCSGVLVRSGIRPRQSALPREARLRNVDGAFRCTAPAEVRGRRVLVVDDVTTTGATMRACLNALREAEAAHVEGLALLRTLDA